MLAVVCLLHYKPIYKDIQNYCQRRAACLTGCIQDNFPQLDCESAPNIDLTYRGQFYDKLFFYPVASTTSYQQCESYISELPHLPVSPFDLDKQLAVHTCFLPCKKPADCLIGFDDDNRPKCSLSGMNRNSGLYCVHPSTQCEQYVEEGQICYSDRVCINWLYILYAILITDALQVVFEGSMLFALEITLKPSYLDKLQYPENNMEEESGD